MRACMVYVVLLFAQAACRCATAGSNRLPRGSGPQSKATKRTQSCQNGGRMGMTSPRRCETKPILPEWQKVDMERPLLVCIQDVVLRWLGRGEISSPLDRACFDNPQR